MTSLHTKVFHRAREAIVLSLAFALCLTFVPQNAVQAQVESLNISRPSQNALITSPLIIAGEARVFENTVNYRLTDNEGDVLVEGFTTANSPDVGEFGDYSVNVPFISPGEGTGRLEIFSLSPENGEEINKIELDVRFANPATTATQIPLYRLWNGSINDHFYTTSAAERDAAVRRFGYTFEGTTGFIYSQPASGLTPLYRMWNGRVTDHFYTTSLTERDAAVSRFGYIAEGTAGYINQSEVSATTPLYRLYNARVSDHFYTAKIAERDAAVNRSGYRAEGTSGFIVEPEPKSLVRVYFGNTFLNPNTTNCRAVFPVIREVPETITVGASSLNELLRGPSTTETTEGYVSALPNDVTLNSLSITNGTARADFNSALDTAAGSCRVQAIRTEIEETLKQFPTVDDVIISVNGRTDDVLQP